MNNKSKKLLKELSEKENLSELIILMNRYDNIKKFMNDGIEIDQVLVYAAKILKERKERIPSGGYFNLISMLR